MSIQAQVQQHYFEKIGVTEGLPNGEIFDIMQDHSGFLWIGSLGTLTRYDGYQFRQYQVDESLPSISGVLTIIEDDEQKIWFGSGNGLYCYNPKTNHFQYYGHEEGNPSSLPNNYIRCLYLDDQAQLWIGTDAGLAVFDTKNNSFRPIPHLADTNEQAIFAIQQDHRGDYWIGSSEKVFILSSENEGYAVKKQLRKNFKVFDLLADEQDRMWLATSNGLYVNEGKDFELQKVKLPNGLSDSWFTRLVKDDYDGLWVGAQDRGLVRLDLKTLAAQHFTHEIANSFSLSNNIIKSLTIDRQHNLWIGTYNGLNKLKISPNFPFYQQEPGLGRPENIIHRVHQDDLGGVWFSTRDRRLFRAEQLGKKAIEIPLPNVNAAATSIVNFYSDVQHRVWIATQEDPMGNFIYNPATKAISKMIRYNTQLRREDPNLEYGFTYIEEDLDEPDFIWLGNFKGLCKMNQRDSTYQFFYPQQNITSLPTNGINKGIQTPDGKIWLTFSHIPCCYLGYFDKKNETFHFVDISPAIPKGEEVINTRKMIRGDSNTVWLATAQGLGKINSTTNTFKLITTEDGLIENQLNGLALDAKGNLWIKSLRHITSYNIKNEHFQHFQAGPDIQELNVTASDIGPDGCFFFGGNNGIYAFYPDSIKIDSTPPKLVLTDFKIANQSVNFETAMELVKYIPIQYADRVISFEFAALHYLDSKLNKYCYKLEGFDKSWSEADTRRSVTYTNLDPGRYIFRVQAANAHGIWTKEDLMIELYVAPPWWRTWWVYLLYAISALGIIYGIYRFQLNRRLALAEANRLQELDNVKNKFFANFTHELRTPLTVILGIVKEILRNPKQYFRTELSVIQRNGQNLLHIVNQILDLTKLEVGKLELKLVQDDIIYYLKYLLESFHSAAAQKDIELVFETSETEIVMDYDPERIRQIVTNLLSNAIKFTPTGGQIKLQVTRQNGQLQLKVSDTGAGISAEHLPHIFDRFYQVSERPSEGTGIGLALTQELVKLMEGNISVTSEVEKGTTFSVMLPIKREAPHREALQTEDFNDNSDTKIVAGDMTDNLEKPLVLIVEDNADVVFLLQRFLYNEYRLLHAPNGQEGLAKAIEHVPDLILSDVMMPEMDGFELTEQLKTNELTSHIPIVLLTALADQDSKIEGLTYGADDYIAKPFDERELRTRVRNLIDTRQKLQAYYRQDSTAASVAEDPFVQRAREIILANISDENFWGPELCIALNLGQSQVHRKLKATTGKATGEFMHHVRVHEAQELLQATDLTVSEAAYRVGYKDQSYFTKKFKAEFGKLPSEMRNT